MLDIRAVRNDTEAVQAALARRRDGSDQLLEALLTADEDRRRLIAEAEELKHRRNVVSETINKTKRAGGSADDLILEMRGVSDRIKDLDAALKTAEETLDAVLLRLPNLPDASVPI